MNKRKKTFILSIIIMFIMLMIPVKSMASEYDIIYNDPTGIPDRVLYQDLK